MYNFYSVVLHLTLIASFFVSSMPRYVCVVQDPTNVINSSENDPIYFTTDDVKTTEDTMRIDTDFQESSVPFETSTFEHFTTEVLSTGKETTKEKPFEIDTKVVIDAPLIACPENQKRDGKGNCRALFGLPNSFKRTSIGSDKDNM